MTTSDRGHRRTLGSVRGEFERWRRSRTRGRRIPESLWGAAVAIAGEHGVSSVSRALGLDYYALKKRVESSADSTPRVEFVELPVGALGGTPECVLELEDGRGARLRVELKGGTTGDCEAVARALWSASR